MKKAIILSLCIIFILLASNCKSKRIDKKEIEDKTIYPIGDKNPVALYDAAVEAYNYKEYDKASFFYEKFIECSNDNIDKLLVYRNWAFSLSRLAQETKENKYWEKANKNFEIASKLDSTDASIYFNWANILNSWAIADDDNKLLFEKCFDKYRQSIELNPTFADSYFNWAIALYQLAKKEKDDSLYIQSFDKFAKAVEIKPNKANFYNNWGNALLTFGEYKNDTIFITNSIDKYKSGIALNDDLRNLYSNYGAALLSLALSSNTLPENKDKIESILAKADSLGDRKAIYNLAKLYSRMGDIDKSMEYIEIGLKKRELD